MNLLALSGATLGLASAATAGTFTVTTNADTTAAGTLRWAITQANLNPGDDFIYFASAFEGANAIYVDPVLGPLPPIVADETHIYGDTAPNSDGDLSSPDVEIQVPSAAGNWAIRISGASDCEVRGLLLVVPAGSGIDLRNGATGNRIGNVGTRELNEMTDCLVGISIAETGTDNNLVYNNFIHDCHDGIHVSMGPRANQIGGTDPGKANAVYRNGETGILLRSQIGGGVVPTLENAVRGNYVGTDSAAATPLGNGGNGIVLEGLDCSGNIVESNLVVDNGRDGIHMLGTDHNRIGPANIIGGNTEEGIDDEGGAASVQNEFVDNWIGLNVAGVAPMPNLGSGIAIRNGASLHQVHGNVIAANDGQGILFDGNYPHDIQVYGNTIGLSVVGVAMGNGRNGILSANASGNIEIRDNLISSNGGYGISLGECGYASFGHLVTGNKIGTDASGMIALGNVAGGILLVGGQTIIAPNATSAGNLISGNLGWGIEVGGCNPPAYTTSLIRIASNGIGVDASGGALPNASGGIWFRDGSADSWIGEPTSTSPNLIRSNGGPGVRIGEAGAAFPPYAIRVLSNSISENATEGIRLIETANGSIVRPIVISANDSAVFGRNTLMGGGSDVLVQVFYDTADEGREFLGEVTVPSTDEYWVLDDSEFLIPLPDGANVTATNTRLVVADEYETSEFSLAVASMLAIPFCFGDGTGTPCPCDSGAPGEGCRNSTGVGAKLSAAGSNSVADADLVLRGSGVPPNKPGLFFQGNAWVGGGSGAPFGDGLLCVGAPIKRLQVRMANAAGEVATTINVAQKGGVVPPVTRYYQLWYRDPLSSCATPSFFNTSNALEVRWRP